MTDKTSDISALKRGGTYVREPDGACNLYHSPVRWNSPIDGFRAWRNGTSRSSLSEWRQVYGTEAEAVHREFRLQPGEYAESYA